MTNRDLRFENNLDQTIKHIMTPKNRLVTVKEDTAREKVLELLHKHRLERLLVVNDKFELCGLITVKDIVKTSEYPSANKDEQGALARGSGDWCG